MTTELPAVPTVLFEIGKLIGADLDPGILLARIAELLGPLLEATACSVMLLDADRKRLLAKAAYGLTGRPQSQSLSFQLGEGVAGWVVEHGEPALIGDVTQDPRFVARASDAAIAAMICVPLIARGERVGVITATSAAPGAFGEPQLELVRFVATTIAIDIENVRLHRVAVTDPLTGAFNREFLLQRLPNEIEIATDRDRALSVAMVDIDHFKDVNEQHGRSAGDLVLAEMARRLRGAIRAGDVLVRYSGAQFLAVLPRADAGRAWEVGERMRKRVSERAFEVSDGVVLLLRVSVGVAQWRAGELMPHVIERANSALFGAKDRGRNRVEVAP